MRHNVCVSHNDDAKGNMGFTDVTLVYDDDAKVEGKTLVIKGKTLVTKGKTLVTEGKTLVTEGKTLVTEGKTLVTEGKTLLTKGKTLVIKGKKVKWSRAPSCPQGLGLNGPIGPFKPS